MDSIKDHNNDSIKGRNLDYHWFIYFRLSQFEQKYFFFKRCFASSSSFLYKASSFLYKEKEEIYPEDYDFNAFRAIKSRLRELLRKYVSG